MWYVYREYANGEAIEEAYDTLREARRAELFIKDYYSPLNMTVGLNHKIGPNGGTKVIEQPKAEKPSLKSGLKNLIRKVRYG